MGEKVTINDLIKEINVLSLKPTDVLVVKVDESLTAQNRVHFMESLRGALGVRVIVVPDSVKFGILREKTAGNVGSV
jgi:hypothetical protein